MWLLQPKHSVESVCEELVAGLEAGRLVDLASEAWVVTHVLDDLRLAGGERSADDAGGFRKAQLVVGHAERGTADEFLARFVAQKDAGPFAAEQTRGLGSNVFQEGRRLALLAELPANVKHGAEPLILRQRLIPRPRSGARTPQ